MSMHLARHHLMSVAPRPDIVFVRGEGTWLVDAGGRRYLDWVQGWAVNCLGHAPAVLVDALARQASTLINPGPAFYNAPALELADLLARLSGLDQVFLASSGAEANEGAIKLARKWGQRHKHGAYRIVTFENGFHGRTLATMSATGKPGWDTLFAPQVPGFPKARLNDIASVERLLDADTVAVMLEPIQGEAGVIPATAEFLGELRQLCDAHGLLLILDEVQTGCGRTGDLFAHQALGVRPDIMTLGKGIGGGVPLAALLASERCACFAPGDQGGTYCGNPLMAAAGAAVLGKLSEPGFLDATRARAADLAEGLQALARSANLGEVRGRGMLLALDLGQLDAHAVVDAARELGLLLNAPRPHCLRFMPALNSTAAEIATGLERLAHAVHVVQSGSGGSAS